MQTQNWVRHNETMIIAVNTILLGANGAIASTFFNHISSQNTRIFFITAAISLVAVGITLYLTQQYMHAITRVVVYEWYFGLHDDFPAIAPSAKKYEIPRKKWENTFVPEYLERPPKLGAVSSKIFVVLQGAVLVASLVAAFCA